MKELMRILYSSGKRKNTYNDN